MFLHLELGKIPLCSTQVNTHHGGEILVAETCDTQLSPVPSKCINRFSSNSIKNKAGVL